MIPGSHDQKHDKPSNLNDLALERKIKNINQRNYELFCNLVDSTDRDHDLTLGISMQEMEERDAIALLKGGDIAGLELLVYRYQNEAVRIAFPITNDLGTAEEAVQEAFVRVYHRIEQFDKNRPFAPWFFRIVVNIAIKIAKRSTREIDDSESYLAITPSNTGNPEAVYENQEVASLMQQALAQLSPKHRAVIVLRYYLDMSEDEIAATVNCPVGTVKSRLNAAKKKLSGMLNLQKCAW